MPCSSSGQAFRAPTAAQLIQPLVRRLKSTRWRSGSENEQNNAMSSSTEPTAADGRSHAIWSEICLPAGGVFRTYELRVEQARVRRTRPPFKGRNSSNAASDI